MLANRPDIIRQDYMDELCVLQDDVPSFPDDEAFEIIEKNLGRPMEQVLSAISERPIAAASLGQVSPRQPRHCPPPPPLLPTPHQPLCRACVCAFNTVLPAPYRQRSPDHNTAQQAAALGAASAAAAGHRRPGAPADASCPRAGNRGAS